MRDRIRQAMADAWGIPPETIPYDAAVDDFPRWDSLGHLELMLALEARFGVHIAASDMLGLLSLEAIENYLRSTTMRNGGHHPNSS